MLGGSRVAAQSIATHVVLSSLWLVPCSCGNCGSCGRCVCVKASVPCLEVGLILIKIGRC
jgi:hypothetical protein